MDVQDRDRLTTAGELSAILAHEIKNPMNSIIINMEVLRTAILEVTGAAETPAAGRAKKYLDVIEGEIKRLDKVIRGFLDLSAPAQTTKVPFKLNPVIQNLADFLAAEMKLKGIRMELKLNSELANVTGSPDQIKQALLNLLINSIQAMPQGGTMEVETLQNDRVISVRLSDSGPGMDENMLSKIFNPYFTTKAKGSGLGLTIVRRVMRDHGGEVRVESVPNQGTTFTLNFPRRLAATAESKLETE